MNVALRPDPAAITYLSLCTGGGGLDLGVELAIPRARALCLVEREAAAVATLVAAMEAGFLAPAPVWSDVRTLDGRRFRGCVDGVVGGIPCQPHSVAGRRGGSTDPRDLWSAARRIVVQSGAWWVLIENVPGMLTAAAGLVPGARRVKQDLERLGFRVAGGLFSAAEVGASHKRERLFILGVADPSCQRERGDARVVGGSTNEDVSCGSARSNRDAIDPGPGMADADGAGPSLGPLLAGDGGAERAASVGVRRDDLVDTARERRGEGWTGAELRRGWGSARRADGGLGDADSQGQPQPVRDLAEGRGWAGDTSRAPARDGLGIAPPGPGDIEGWRAVVARRPDLAPATESYVRRVADGLAGGVDLARAADLDRFRADALRLLGNGVHPLAAAYAIRTLGARLACDGSRAAIELVGMMDR